MTTNKYLARRRLIDYCVYVDPDPEYRAIYRDTQHLNYLAEKLEAVERGEIKRLMIFTVNRHLKSSLVTMKFPSWWIGKRFEAAKPHQVIIISHTVEKAEEFSEYSRNLARDSDMQGRSRYRNVFPHMQISRVNQSSKEWGLLNQDSMEETFPSMTAGSMNAPPVGSGADLLIIDDPIKSSIEARSPATQKLHLNNYREGLRTRMNSPDAPIIIVMTRWSVSDICGQLLRLAKDDPIADQWEVVVLPALAYTSKEIITSRRVGIPTPDKCPLGREPGQALWPANFPRAHHLSTKANGPLAFASIGQQLPVQEGGQMLGRDAFKRLDGPPMRGDGRPERIRWIIPLDAAFKEKQLAKDDPDFNVFGVLGFWGDRADLKVILGCLVRTQKGLTAAKEIAVRFALAMEKLTGVRPPIIGDQASLDNVLLNDLRGKRELLGWSIRSLGDRRLKRKLGSFVGDKVAKFEPWRDRAEGGRFYVLDETWALMALIEAFPKADRRRLLGEDTLAWHEKFFSEVEGFPDWPHDDMVDMVSCGYHTAGMQQQEQRKAGSHQG